MAKPKEVVVDEEEVKSEGLEITSIGSLYEGPWEKKYWSSSRVRFTILYLLYQFLVLNLNFGFCFSNDVSETVFYVVVTNNLNRREQNIYI